MRRMLAAAAFATASFVAGAVEPPRVWVRDAWVQVRLSGTLLDDDRVRQRAESGLTATLVMFDRAERDRETMARISIRWEPWDEIFLVSIVHADGVRDATREIDSLEALRRHVNDASIRLRPARSVEKDRVTVEVRLVPFSSEEAHDAREWFLDTLGSTPKGSVRGGADSADGIVDVLLATSIQARPIASWTWKVPVQTAREDDP